MQIGRSPPIVDLRRVGQPENAGDLQRVNYPLRRMVGARPLRMRETLEV
jgi:hypothetical protein